MNSYRIVYVQYFDDKAVSSMEHYLVERWVKGFFGGRWQEFGADSYSGWSPTRFASVEDARAFVARIATGKPRLEWVHTPVETGGIG
jgi:hypothetical protein